MESLNEHDLNDIDNLRDILKGSLITTYRYKPLVGIISKTNSSNKKTFYQYDSQNRLEFVKDHTGNIIKESSPFRKLNCQYPCSAQCQPALLIEIALRIVCGNTNSGGQL